MAAKASKDVYCEKPCSMTIGEAILANTMRATGACFRSERSGEVSAISYSPSIWRSGKLGKLRTLHASIAYYKPQVVHDWLPAEPEPPKEMEDWDMWLGPAPWRPYNHAYVAGIGGWLCCFDFNAGGGFLNWASHTVDLCQWANQADGTTPVEFEPVGARGYAAKRVLHARYANGTKLVMCAHDAEGWLNLGSCSVRFRRGRRLGGDRR